MYLLPTHADYDYDYIQHVTGMVPSLPKTKTDQSRIRIQVILLCRSALHATQQLTGASPRETRFSWKCSGTTHNSVLTKWMMTTVLPVVREQRLALPLRTYLRLLPSEVVVRRYARPTTTAISVRWMVGL